MSNVSIKGGLEQKPIWAHNEALVVTREVDHLSVAPKAKATKYQGWYFVLDPLKLWWAHTHLTMWPKSPLLPFPFSIFVFLFLVWLSVFFCFHHTFFFFYEMFLIICCFCTFLCCVKSLYQLIALSNTWCWLFL